MGGYYPAPEADRAGAANIFPAAQGLAVFALAVADVAATAAPRAGHGLAVADQVAVARRASGFRRGRVHGRIGGSSISPMSSASSGWGSGSELIG
jgi:hypothetical protein